MRKRDTKTKNNNSEYDYKNVKYYSTNNNCQVNISV